jgi:co-chaperonin GroES (HSP10)
MSSSSAAPTTLSNCILYVPMSLASPIGAAIFAVDTMQYCAGQTESGIVLPQGKKDALEKKYEICEVVQIGPDVKRVKVGDIVLLHTTTMWRVPNGLNGQMGWKVEENPHSVIMVLPNLNHPENPDWTSEQLADFRKYREWWTKQTYEDQDKLGEVVRDPVTGAPRESELARLAKGVADGTLPIIGE